jgi:hypothetical protein
MFAHTNHVGGEKKIFVCITCCVYANIWVLNNTKLFRCFQFQLKRFILEFILIPNYINLAVT